MSPSELREAVGIKSRIHFSRYCMTPLMEKGLTPLVGLEWWGERNEV